MLIFVPRSFKFSKIVSQANDSYQKKNRWTVQVKKWAYGPKSTKIAEKSKFDQYEQKKKCSFLHLGASNFL